ncbi:hypothetical protein OLMES_4039 [Oleiphilus messinensis]|uniref:Uncharacterized protein n=1 Tax=Oleiphilus messinensis TaxID=141451 RepID=A0A1Y0IC14_9GAMM|nr:hypothetical protein [Oleiphilus messinensis]ARU58057.1 hypothetical protein OLMES_4039 [Oleiphilus messinensis]
MKPLPKHPGYFLANSAWGNQGIKVYIPETEKALWKRALQANANSGSSHVNLELFKSVKSLSDNNPHNIKYSSDSQKNHKIQVTAKFVIGYKESTEHDILITFIAPVSTTDKPPTISGNNPKLLKQHASEAVNVQHKNDHRFVLPPYFKATYDENNQPLPANAKATYVDPDSLEVKTTEWASISDLLEVGVWGAFKGLATYRLGQVLRLPDESAGIAGGFGATTEQLSLQTQFRIYSVTISDWNGDVYHGIFGGVKAVDFKYLSNTRRVNIEILKQYRIMAGNTPIYTAKTERVAGQDHKEFIANAVKNGYPNEDR